MTYEELLKRGMKKVPEELKEHGRFKMPEVSVTPAGAKTYINNFYDIAKDLRREPGHLLKFMLKELATKGDFEGKRLLVIGRFPESQINGKIELYVRQFVICPECGRPDTRIIKDDDFRFLKCEACGAKHSLGK
jgi:translation initiation factor 2 subunit 2